MTAGNQAEYAKHRRALKLRGETEAAVSQALATGRIKAAVRPDGLIDFAEADRLWAASRVPRVEFAPADEDPESGAEKKADAGVEFLKAKARRETAEADMAELKAAKARGELVDVGEARKVYHAIGRMFSQARENVPLQLAPKLVGKTDLAEIESTIRIFYREADARVAGEIQSRFAGIVGVEVEADDLAA